MLKIPVLAVLALTASACSSTSPCQHFASSASTAATEAAPCTNGSTQGYNVNVNQCGLACSTIEQTKLDQAATCLDALGTCNPANASMFESAAAVCGTDITGISSSCLASLGFGTVTTTRMDAGTSTANTGSPCENLVGALNAGAAKIAPCSDAGFVTLGSAFVSSCDTACSSSSDQAELQTMVGCFDNLPTCSASTESSFLTALQACETELMMLSTACKQVL
jgi:hypothetical protein